MLHELGHAFGLWDTYLKGKRKSTGGSDRTSGKHVESIMSGRLSSSEPIMELTHDDVTGIHDIYRYHVLGYRNEKECSSAEFIWDKDSRGCVPKYPVIFATKYGNESILDRLLKDDPSVNVNEIDPFGNTALHEAVALKLDDVVGVLLDENLRGSDIDVNITNNDGQTPLHLLASVGYPEKNEDTPDDSLSANAKDNSGKNPVVNDQGEEAEEMFLGKLLNHSNIDLNIKDNEGKTPLHLSIDHGFKKAKPIIDALLTHGIDVDLKNN